MNTQRKHNPKDIELAGMKHAKAVICELLDTQAELVAALDGVIAVTDRDTDEFIRARAALAKARGA